MLALLPAPTRSPIPSASRSISELVCKTLLPPLACRGRSCLPPSPASPRQILHPLWPVRFAQAPLPPMAGPPPPPFSLPYLRRKPEALGSRHTHTHTHTHTPPHPRPASLPPTPGRLSAPPSPRPARPALRQSGAHRHSALAAAPAPRSPPPPGPRCRHHRRRRLPSGRGGGGAGEEAPLGSAAPDAA